MSRVLGIDPGKHHAGVCVFDTESNRIVSWGMYAIDDTTIDACIESCRSLCHEALGSDPPSSIMIERQPPKNGTMCRISHYLQMYLALAYPGIPISMVPPTRRIKYVRDTRPDLPFETYAQRKKSSIAFVASWLESTGSEWIAWFGSQKKQDDCAESFLLCLLSTRSKAT